MRGSLLFQRRTLRQLVISSTLWSKQNKLILFLSLCCVALTLVFLLVSSSSLQSHHQLNLRSPAPNRRTRKGYTLLINTWKRYDLLKQSISHYASCPMLDSVHIIWSEPDPPSKSLVDFLNYIVQSSSKDGHQVELKFDINKEDSLNNRFKERDLKTDAVFSIDDDVIFPCSSVDFAFSVWLSAQDTMVGFVPRMHWLSELHDNTERYTYGGWWSVWWTGTYSMVLSKAAFFHKKYLKMYTNEMPSSIREFVTRNRNCEDIAMSFLVANASGAPPIWVKGKIFEIGSSGISSMGGHTEKRSYCVNRFAAEYGQMPLISTTAKAVDSRNIWFW